MLNGTTSSANSPSPGPAQQSRPQPMLPIRRLGARSSILCHTFPSFYACYLLKSIQTPQATAVYIGSTPSPPRRIRQHNGEISQGARKTQRKRPWVMQMIVHGFPSRLAALQFEWAWQHPHKSRHLRDGDKSLFGPKRTRVMAKNIAIVRAMIARHPFNTWPLHVKLFTEEALQYWNASARIPQVLPLPPGFTCSIELEGVDGKSGHPGSGRQGPITADDEEFSSALLAKNTALIASGRPLDCSVCDKPLHSHIDDPLSTALCPSTGCFATSHLACLGQRFLKEETVTKNLIPRGGNCPSCGTYTLWGDIVRGCYRRLPPAERNGPQHPDIASDDMFVTDEDSDSEATPRRRSKSPTKRRRSSTRRRRSRKQKGKATVTESSEGESFDFDNIASSSESDNVTPMKRRPERPRLTPSSKASSSTTAKRKDKTTISNLLTPNILSNANNIASSSDSSPATPVKRSPRPRKIMAFASPDTSPSKSPSTSTTTKRKGKTTISNPLTPNNEGELVEVSNIASSSNSGPTTPVKRSPARPRKIVAFASPDTSPDVSPTISTATKRKGKAKVSNLSTPNNTAKLVNVGSIASSSDSESVASVKRSPGRPRKIVAFASPDTSSDVSNFYSNKTKKAKGKKKGRRAKSASASSSTSSSEGEFFDFTSVESSLRSDDAAPLKRKVGRPRKNLSSLPNIQPSLVKHQTHLPLHAHDMSSPGRPYATTSSSRLRAEPIFADSSSDIEILHDLHRTAYYTNNTQAGRTPNYHTPRIPHPARPSSSSNSLNSRLDKTLERAMSALSVSTPSRPPVGFNKNKDRHGEDIEVIVLSD
ncbi:hypothetical protein BJ912DRAFT_1039597 [Pholiota molesta]|nr:hypothetical protein BJ912DRAFT_1039597 [Pholiota molesta]